MLSKLSGWMVMEFPNKIKFHKYPLESRRWWTVKEWFEKIFLTRLPKIAKAQAGPSFVFTCVKKYLNIKSGLEW